LLLIVAANLMGGLALVLLWPAATLLYVAALYGFDCPSGFGKSANGRVSPIVQGLLAPYLLGAWLNSRIWTRRHPGPDRIADTIWLGRIPSARDLLGRRFVAVIDLCAELPACRRDLPWTALPVLDLTTPPVRTLVAAAQAIEHARRLGPVLVVCALGYGRGASAVAAWLVMTGRADTADDAAARIRARRPGVVLGKTVCAAIDSAKQDGIGQSP
jgi:protein-tyrosine phosphatase